MMTGRNLGNYPFVLLNSSLLLWGSLTPIPTFAIHDEHVVRIQFALFSYSSFKEQNCVRQILS